MISSKYRHRATLKLFNAVTADSLGLTKKQLDELNAKVDAMSDKEIKEKIKILTKAYERGTIDAELNSWG